MRFEEVNDLVGEVRTLAPALDTQGVYKALKVCNIDKHLWKPLLLRMKLVNSPVYSRFDWVGSLYRNSDEDIIENELNTVLKIYNKFIFNNKEYSRLREIYNGNTSKLGSLIGESAEIISIANKLYEYSLTGEDILLSYLIDFDKRHTISYKNKFVFKCKELLPIEAMWNKVKNFEFNISCVGLVKCCIGLMASAIFIALVYKISCIGLGKCCLGLVISAMLIALACKIVES